LAALDDEIARQDVAAAQIQSSNAHVQDEIRSFLELVGQFGEHNGTRRWTLSSGGVISGWVIDHGTLLLSTEGRVLRYGHMHLDAPEGGSVWHDWNRPCDAGINQVGHITDLPEDLVQLLATTYRDLRNRNVSGSLAGPDSSADPRAAILAVADPVERLLRAAYLVGRERHDFLLARPVSREDMELLCPEFFPVRPGANGTVGWGPVDIGRWFADKAGGTIPTNIRLTPSGGRRMPIIGRRGGAQIEGWKVGARDRSARSPVVAVATDGAVYEQHGRGWQLGRLHPHHLRRMAELLNAT
jgi:hypothetical protein